MTSTIYRHGRAHGKYSDRGEELRWQRGEPLSSFLGGLFAGILVSAAGAYFYRLSAKRTCWPRSRKPLR